MNCLVDTGVWSLALRRSTSQTGPLVYELGELIREMRVRIIGPIRQEILSGIRHESQFERIRDKLRAFPDIPLDSIDFETAASFFNTCRSKGVQGSNTDFLICAVAKRHNLSILTTDNDFQHYALHVPLRLHEPRS